MKKLLILLIVIAMLVTAVTVTAYMLDDKDSDDGTATVTAPGGDEDSSTASSSGDNGNNTVTPPKDENGKAPDKPHTHNYVWKITKPTKTTQGTATGKCECGDMQTNILPVITDNRYGKVTTSTCGKAGQTTYSLKLNGEMYIFTLDTPATGEHLYQSGVCSTCGAVNPDYVPHTHSPVDKSDTNGHWTECACGDKTEVIPHKYSYDNDDDCHWLVCSVKGETIENVSHSYKDGICVCGAEEPLDPNGVKSITIQHTYGDGKYLWNASDVASSEYNLFDATLQITHNDGTVTYEPVTVEMLGDDIDVTEGCHSITVKYGGKTAEFSVFVAPEDGYIEAVANETEITGLSEETLFLDLNSSGDFNFNGLEIKGFFNTLYNGKTYSDYYGTTPVNERFIKDFDEQYAGFQTYKITAGNISSTPAVLASLDVMSYDSTETEEKVFVSEIRIIKNDDYSVAFYTSLDPGRPYLDLQKITGRENIYEPDYHVEFEFGIGQFTEYIGGGDRIVKVDNVSKFNSVGYEMTGDINLHSVILSGERLIRLSRWSEEKIVEYTTYDSKFTNIRFCRVHGESVVSYELSDGVTLDSIKEDLLKRELFVEYFEKVDGKYLHLVPIEENMIDFSKVDVNSYLRQNGQIKFYDKLVAVNIIKPYTVAGASVSYTLINSTGLNLVLSEMTVNDLACGLTGDLCKEIVLYNNGVAMLKHTGNGIGNVLVGYELNGNKLTLLRHGSATAYLTVNLTSKTFDKIDLATVTSGMSSTTYSFTYSYFPETNSYLSWAGRFTAYTGETGYAYSWYASVDLTGWASSLNSDGYTYEIAGIEYIATWAFGWHNNKKAFVLRFADMDWWFEIGAVNDSGDYRLTFVQTSQAS